MRRIQRKSSLSLRTILLTGSALALGAGAAAAQPATDSPTDEVLVTGFKQALEGSVALKKKEESIVEVVSAEEVGKLPDVSIAESLGRLPGLATQRLNGRSNVLSIRGLGPDFSTALLNGREQVTTSDNRGVEFDQYPAELLSQAVVYKTPFSGLIGQGLAGTVDLRTVRPLDQSKRTLAFSSRYEFNEDGSLNPDAPSGGYRFTGTYVDQFLNDTLGVAIGVAAQRSPTQEQQFNAWGYGGDGTAASPLVIGGQKPFSGSDKLDRIGGFFTLQYRPNDNFTSTADVFYTDFNEDNIIRGIEFPLAFGGGFGVPAPTITNQVDGFATDGVFTNVRGVIRNDLNLRRAELFSAGWNGKYKGDNGFGAEFDFSYSKATRRDELIESYSGTGYGPTGGAADTLTFSQAPGGIPTFQSVLDYAATSGPNAIVLTDPLGWGSGNDVVQAGFINAPRTDDTLYHLKYSVNQDVQFSLVKNVELGIDYGRREKSRDIDQIFLTLPGATSSLAGGATQELAIPQEAILGGQTAGIGFLGFGPQVTLNTRYLLDNVYVPVVTQLSSFSTPQSWVVRENTVTGWAKFSLNGDVGTVPLTGNFGLQVVYTDQSSDGLAVAATAPGTLSIVPVTDGDKYTKLLPNLNLIFNLSDSLKLRFGAARALARARLDQLSASENLSFNLTALANTNPLGQGGTAFGLNSGNPRLRPYISNQVDLSLEKYFGGAGYVSLAVYYKDLQDFVNSGDAFVQDFTSAADVFLTPAQRAALGTTQGLNRSPSNNGEGRIRGFEASVSIPLSQVSKRLDGFGFLTSGSFTDSRVTLTSTTDPTSSTTITVPGLSKWVVNSTVYYEKNGFEARVSHRFRTGFLGEVAAISATRTFRTTRGESIIDAQIGYSFHGALQGLRLTAQGLNLTDEPFETTSGDDRQLIDSQSFGRTYLIGASYSF